MEERIKQLEERLRAVEKTIYMVFGGAIVIGICSLAFLGIEYWRIPKAVDRAIGQETLDRVRNADDLAKSFLKEGAEVVHNKDTVTLNSSGYNNKFIRTSGGDVYLDPRLGEANNPNWILTRITKEKK